MLTDTLRGQALQQPQRRCVDGQGRIWFTDPRYGDRSALEMDVEGVYRIDPDGNVTRVLEPAGRPTAQRHRHHAGRQDPVRRRQQRETGGNRKIWAFDCRRRARLGKQRLVYDFGKGRGGDGMRLDTKGNLWVAAGIRTPRPPGEVTDIPPGVYVISPQGKLLGRIPIPEDYVTNLAFGGPDRKTLYVTAGTSVYKVPLTVSGYAVYPPLRP